MPDAHANFAYSTVLTAPSPASSGLSLVAQSGDGALFGTPPFNMVVGPATGAPRAGNAEIVRVTAISGDTFTIVRQQESTSARSIGVGDQMFAAFTRKAATDIESALTLQNGVVNAADAALSSLTVNSGSGLITVTLAAANPVWVNSTASLLIAVAFAGGAVPLTPGALPATGKFRGYGIEIDTAGALSLNAGTDQTTAALALTNINTVAAAGKLRVLDVVVQNTAGSYSNAGTRDRRPWARGGYNVLNKNATATQNSVTAAAVDATNLTIRMECTGVPVRLRFNGYVNTPGSVEATHIDGRVDATTMGNAHACVYNPGAVGAAEFDAPFTLIADATPTAGSRLFQPYWWIGGSGTITLQAGCQFSVEEMLRQNANNGTS